MRKGSESIARKQRALSLVATATATVALVAAATAAIADSAARCSNGGNGILRQPARRIKYHSIYPSNICAFTVERRIRGPFPLPHHPPP